MPRTNDRPTKKLVTLNLDEETIMIIDQISQRLSLNNRSATVRQIFKIIAQEEIETIRMNLSIRGNRNTGGLIR